MIRQITKTLCLLLTAFLLSQITYAQNWEPVGSLGFSDGSVWFPNVVLDANNTPYVAYLDYVNNYHKVRVKKYTGNSWQEVGTTGFPTMADRVSLVLDPNGLPVIAYQTFDESLHGVPQNFKIRVKRFNGSSWVDVGTTFIYESPVLLEEAPGSYNPTLAIDASGTLYVSLWHFDYLEDENNKLINGATVVKFDGSSWVTIGEAGFTNQQADYLTMAVSPNGTPYIAYNQVYDSQGFESRKVSVMRFNGGEWVNVGPPSFSEKQGNYPSLKIAGNGTPYIAYINSDPNLGPTGKPTVQMFNGSNWVDVGTSGLPDGIGNNASGHISLELTGNGIPYVAYDIGDVNFVNGRTRVQKLDGSTWVNIGGSGFTYGGYNTDLGLDANGNPYVLFMDGENLNKASVMRYIQQPVNTAPVLSAIGNKTVNELSALTFQAAATDDGLPSNSLIYSLASAAAGNYPTGATISTTGAFSWTPTEAQGSGVYRVKIVVSDGELTDAEEIEIQVKGLPVLSTNTPCLPDAILSLSNAADASQIVWYKGDNIVSTIKPVPAPQGTTVAGGNGPGSAANQFNSPVGVFVDGDGNIYVVESNGNRVQKWVPGATEGITVAGGNGQGSAANQLIVPSDIFLDKYGNIYVADVANNRIQKWAPGATEGITVAGGNSAGAAANQLNQPTGVFVDGSGNIYIADRLNNRIQKWAPGATEGITVAGGNGRGSAANQLSFPGDVFLDINGNMYIADETNYRIQKWALDATSGTTVAGGNDKGSAANQFEGPFNVFVDGKGNIFVGDGHNHRVQMWIPGAAEGITIAGGNGAGAAANQLNYAAGTFVDNSGNIYVVDGNNQRIQKWAAPTINTTFTPTEAGTYNAAITYGAETLISNTVAIYESLAVSVNIEASPSTIIAEGSSVTFTATPVNGGQNPLYQWKVNGNNVGTNSATFTISTLINGDVVTCELTSASSCIIGNNTATSNSLKIRIAPVLSTSSPCLSDALFSVSNATDASKIIWYNGDQVVNIVNSVPATQGTTVAGGNGSGSVANQFNQPVDLFINNNGDKYIVDAANHRIQKWAPGAIEGITVAGGNGAGSAANQFNVPQGLFVDNNGNIYVADVNNNRIQKWAPGATEGITVAGGNGQGFAPNQLYNPFRVFVDESGNIFISDGLNHRIQKWAPGATEGITVAGGNGQGSAANQLNIPAGIFIDNNNNIYVADQQNHRIQKWTPGAIEGITVAGGNGAGSAANQLIIPNGVFVDNNTIYVSDRGNNRIQKWAPGATEGITVAGGNGQGSAANQFHGPLGLSVDENGNMYVADLENHRIQKWAAPTINTTYTPTSPGTYTAVVNYGSESISTNAVVIESLPVSVSIEANPSTTIATGTSVTFTATPVNGGTNPTYQWKVNESNVGSNSPSYTLSTLADGDIITCELTSDAACATGNPATSNALTMVVNTAPVLSQIGNKTVAEGAELSFTVTAEDDASQTLTYSLTGTVPSGAVIDATTGLFDWTPTEAQGPDSYTFTVQVTDNGTGTLSDSEEITVSVEEVNQAPVLAAIANQTVDAGSTLTFTASATDADLPANTLTYSLEGSIPAGAGINSVSGAFTWTPTNAQAGQTYTITVKASDNGTPVYSDEKSFQVTVQAVAQLPVIASFSPSSGSVGTTVTINGSNLLGATSVTFNGVSALINTNTATQIVATVPSGATTGLISVTTAGGTATSSTAFTVTYPRPSISSFTPTSGPVGTVVTITGTNFFSGVTTVRFNNMAASVVNVISITTLMAVVPQGATSGKISVTTPGGNANSKGNFTITAGNVPVISSFSPTSGPVGTQVSINGNNLQGATSVQFNGTSATYIVSGNNLITATVPQGAKSGKITVVTSGGTTSSRDRFTVTTPRARLAAEEDQQASVKLYPNPVQDKVFIDLEGLSTSGITTVLTDAVGKSVLHNAHKAVGESLLELDMSGLRSGLYIIQLRTESMYKIIKVVKQ